MRTKLQAKLNTDLRDIIILDAEPHNPWYDLETKLRLPTLLACTLPATWHLSKYRTTAWYRSLETRLKKQLTHIIKHCHACNKDLQIKQRMSINSRITLLNIAHNYTPCTTTRIHTCQLLFQVKSII
jgi:hypothetical protein